MLVPLGISSTFNSACTPNACASEPASRLNFIASISENDNNSTKKHINSAIESAKVASHGGRPSLGMGLLVNSSSLIAYHSPLFFNFSEIAFAFRQISTKHRVDNARVLATLNRQQGVDNEIFDHDLLRHPQS